VQWGSSERHRRADSQPTRRTDGRTDRHDEANSLFRSFANTPKIGNYMTSAM